MSICEDWAYVLFVCGGYVFLGVTVCSVSECSDDIQPGFGSSVDVLCVLFECHPSVQCHSKDGGSVVDRNRGVEKGYQRLGVIFSIVWCDECEGGFGCGYCKSIVGEPVFQLLNVLLKVCGCGLVFWVL